MPGGPDENMNREFLPPKIDVKMSFGDLLKADPGRKFRMTRERMADLQENIEAVRLDESARKLVVDTFEGSSSRIQNDPKLLAGELRKRAGDRGLDRMTKEEIKPLANLTDAETVAGVKAVEGGELDGYLPFKLQEAAERVEREGTKWLREKPVEKRESYTGETAQEAAERVARAAAQPAPAKEEKGEVDWRKIAEILGISFAGDEAFEAWVKEMKKKKEEKKTPGPKTEEDKRSERQKKDKYGHVSYGRLKVWMQNKRDEEGNGFTAEQMKEMFVSVRMRVEEATERQLFEGAASILKNRLEKEATRDNYGLIIEDAAVAVENEANGVNDYKNSSWLKGVAGDAVRETRLLAERELTTDTNRAVVLDGEIEQRVFWNPKLPWVQIIDYETDRQREERLANEQREHELKMAEKMRGGTGETKIDSDRIKAELNDFLNEMAEAEEVNIFSEGNRLEQIKRIGKFSTESKLAIDAFVGLLRLNRQMGLGGGRFDVIAKALYFENPNKFGGYVAQAGMARLLKEDDRVREATEVLGAMFGIKVPGREDVAPSMSLKKVVGLTSDQVEQNLQEVQKLAKCDKLQAVAAFTLMRALGYGQGLDHYTFVSQFVIGANVQSKDKLGEDLDWADVKPYMEKAKLDKVWQEKGTQAFIDALSSDKGPLYKYWDDKTKLRGGLLQIMGDRQASVGNPFVARYKDLVGKVTEMSGKDQLFDDNSPGSGTARRLTDTNKISKDPPTMNEMPDFISNERAAINKLTSDIASLFGFRR